MSVSQTRAARRKIKLRYRTPPLRSASEAIAVERVRAAREARAKGKTK